MKKLHIAALLLALVMMLTSVAGAVSINPNEKRGITPKDAGYNEVEDGISPTTGLPLEDYDVPNGFAGLAVTGRYQPMMVQIDNTNGGVDSHAPWGATYADLVYETPLYSNGFTRISFIFSDLIPDSVGPVRSARVGHCWIREEWGAGFMYYGGQKRKGSSIDELFKNTGASKKGVLFSGTDSKTKPWKQFYTRRSGVAAPGNVDVNAAAIYELIPESHEAPNHTFLFTDDIPDGDTAEQIDIHWSTHYDSRLVYDADSNLYYRYMVYPGDEMIAYEDRDSGDQLCFSNVIIQHTKVVYNGNSDAPVARQIGEGNADFFMGGVHMKGYWKRSDEGVKRSGGNNTDGGVNGVANKKKYSAGRTVFYTEDGNELEMLRGKTLIIVLPDNSGETGIGTASYQ